MKRAIRVHVMLIGPMTHSFAFFSSSREWLSKTLCSLPETCAYLHIREATDHGSQSASIISDSKSPDSFLFSLKLTSPCWHPFFFIKKGWLLQETKFQIWVSGHRRRAVWSLSVQLLKVQDTKPLNSSILSNRDGLCSGKGQDWDGRIIAGQDWDAFAELRMGSASLHYAWLTKFSPLCRYVFEGNGSQPCISAGRFCPSISTFLSQLIHSSPHQKIITCVIVIQSCPNQEQGSTVLGAAYIHRKRQLLP